MKRRDFLLGSVGLSACSVFAQRGGPAVAHAADVTDGAHACCGPTYASPADAMVSPRETLALIPAIYCGTASRQPDYLATVDVAPDSPTYGRIVHRLPMPHVGDELHHFGWNACSSCHGDPNRSRRYLVVPGISSGRIHILDAANPRQVKLHKVIEGRDIAEKVNLSAPHTVHCLPDGHVMISMLGDAAGQGPGGFLLLDDRFDIAGRWEQSTEGMHYNYDFWYQPRHNVMVSSEWAAPTTFRGGFKPDDVAAGLYGHRLHFWDWQQRRIGQTIDLGEYGRIPLEVRFHHNPDSTHGFVGAALSSSIWHFHESDAAWSADKIVQVEPVEMKGWPFPVPGLITDLVLSLDDRYLYFSNWLHGDIRQYDVSDPSDPRLTGQVWLGGVLGKNPSVRGRELAGGPQMLQLSLDGKRLYVTNSLFSVWDNQFYPAMAERGSYLMQIDCDTSAGGMTVHEEFFVDFKNEPNGPARAHEIRFPGGDSTSDIWI
jgi:selenium-binding protein 1